MSVQTFYRLAVWLPLIPPLLLLPVLRTFGFPTWPLLDRVVEVLLLSLVYGGLPYAVLAVWATIWIDHRPEPAIRRLALYAPLLMAGTFTLLVLVIFVRELFYTYDRRDVAEMVGGLFLLGSAFSIGLGYIWVAIVFALRRALAGVITARASVPQPG